MTTSPELPGGVARTALGVARARAVETRRPDRLVEDPYAEVFVDAASLGEPGGSPDDGAPDDGAPDERGIALARWVGAYIPIRTRFFDDELLAACARGCRQVVLVAAGLDTRAYRLPWPDGVRPFELDLPEVLAFKQHVLDDAGAAPGCERTEVPLDLRADWTGALRGAGLDPAAPTAWLVEGLIIYLTANEASTLLERVDGLSAPGSILTCETQAARDPGRPASDGRLPAYADLWKGGLRARLPDRLRELGWSVVVRDRFDVAAGYGRDAPPSGGAGFAVATRAAR